jgi:O-antigen/teichoic acid export membrane protein
MNKQTIIKNSFFSVIQIILSTLSYLIIYYLILTKLGKESLGIWSLVTSLPIAISVFGSGVSGCILRYVPVYFVKEDKKAFNEIIFNGLVINILLGLIFVILGYYYSVNILKFLFDISILPIEYIDFFKISLLTFFINFILSVFLFTIDGMQLIYLRNKIIIFGSIIFCILAFLSIDGFGLKGILFSQLIQSILLLIMSIFIIVKQKIFNLTYQNLNIEYFKLFFTFGKKFQFISISILLFDPITKYFLNKYFNLQIVGVYDLISRAITQIRIMIVSSVQVITPLISMLKEKNILKINETYNMTYRGSYLLSFVIFGMYLPISMLLVILFDKDNSILYLSISLSLLISYYFNILASSAYSIYTGLGELNNIIFSHIMSTLFNILFFLILKKYLNPNFIALPTAFSVIISSFYLIYTFKKKYISNSSYCKNDLKIILISLFSILLTTIIIMTNLNIYWIILLIFLHFILLSIQLFQNDFFIKIVNKLLNK